MDMAAHQPSTAGRRRVSGFRQRRGSKTGLSITSAFLFGALFVATGTMIILVGARVIEVDPKTVHAPWFVLIAAGAVFALGGLMVWSMAWTQYRANRRRLEMARKYGEEAALTDYAWDPRGFEVPRWKRVANTLGGALFFMLFLSLFNWWAFFADGPWPVKTIVVLFDAVLIGVWWYVMVLFGRAVKFGGSRIEFGRFPLRLGEPIMLYWQAASRIGRITEGEFTLRCVEEFIEQRGHGKNRSAAVVHEELWSTTWRLDFERAAKMGTRVELRFDVPPDAPSTHLSAEKPVFWELEVKLDLPGLDFREIYLVPIYAR